MLSISAGRVVAQLANLPAHAVPDLVQVGECCAKHLLCIAPDLQLALAGIHGGRCGAGLADGVAAPQEQAMFGQLLGAIAVSEDQFRPYFQAIAIKNNRSVFGN